MGGATRGEGRVEVQFRGVWGTICDDFWGLDDANVNKRQFLIAETLSHLVYYTKAPSVFHRILSIKLYAHRCYFFHISIDIDQSTASIYISTTCIMHSTPYSLV